MRSTISVTLTWIIPSSKSNNNNQSTALLNNPSHQFHRQLLDLKMFKLTFLVLLSRILNQIINFSQGNSQQITMQYLEGANQQLQTIFLKMNFKSNKFSNKNRNKTIKKDSLGKSRTLLRICIIKYQQQEKGIPKTAIITWNFYDLRIFSLCYYMTI